MVADGYVRGQHAVYATAHATSTSVDITNPIVVGQHFTAAIYYCSRGLLKFNTTLIGAGSEIVSATMTLVPTIIDGPTRNFDISIVKYNWSANDPLSAGNKEAAFDGVIAAIQDVVFRNTSGMVIGTPYTSPPLDPTWINKTGPTYYGLVSSLDQAASAPSGAEQIRFGSANDSLPANLPILTVVYQNRFLKDTIALGFFSGS